MEKYSIIKNMKEEKPKLLVVDDEESQSDSIKAYFSRRNFSVFTAATGEEALANIKDHKPDLILLDIKLAGAMDGRDVLSALRRHDKETKVIVITGNMLSQERIQEIKEMGIIDFLLKPVEVQRLDQIVKKVLSETYPKALRFKAIKGIQTKTGNASLRRLSHELSNVTGDITNKCELYLLDTEEGLYKGMTEKERLEKAIGVIKSVSKSTERLTELGKKLAFLAKKET